MKLFHATHNRKDIKITELTHYEKKVEKLTKLVFCKARQLFFAQHCAIVQVTSGDGGNHGTRAF